MEPWSGRSVRDRMKHPHELLEKRLCEDRYMNAYEFALFTNVDLCLKLSNCMHGEGLIIRDTVSPEMMNLAFISDNLHNYAALCKIKWNKKTFAGVMRRPDFVKLLLRRDYDLNGFEFGISIMPKLIGTVILKYDLIIADVIRFDIFKECKGIKELFLF